MKLIRLICTVKLYTFLVICNYCYATDFQGIISTEHASTSSLYSSTEASSLLHILPIEQEIQWQVYAPVLSGSSSIQQKSVLIYISPSSSGAPPKDWLPALDKHNVIFIGADGFGNKVPVRQRALVAVMGIKMLKTKFDIGVNFKTYVAGFSGGGRVASFVIEAFPRTFEGAAYFSGVNFWKTRDKKQISEIIEKPFVFVTGRRDFNRRDTVKVFKKYKRAGAKNTLLMDIPGYRHQLPDQKQFEAVIAFLTLRD